MARRNEARTDEEVKGVYVISVAAQLVGMHPQTLRNYERTGLFRPSRTSGGSRRFSNEDIERLKRIQQLTSEGHNLESVRRILELEREVARLHAELEDATARATELLQATHRSYRRDLVPLHQTTVVWRAPRKRSDA